jgi:hypothetical protein
MRAGRFFAVFGMVAILASSRVAHADLDNGEKSSAPKRVALDDFLESVSELKKLEDKPPASEEALRRRARPRSQPARRCRAQPRLLGRGILLRGRHSSRPGKGYGDGQAPPRYHVASVKVLGPDGQPLSIPQDEKKLPHSAPNITSWWACLPT